MRRSFLFPILLLLVAAPLPAQKTANLRTEQSEVLGDMTNIDAGFPFFQWRWGRLIAWSKREQTEGRVAVYSPSSDARKSAFVPHRSGRFSRDR